MIDSLRIAVAKTISAFRDEVSSVRSKLEAAKRRREDLWASSLSKADVVELLCGHVDVEGSKYTTALQNALQNLLTSRSIKTGENSSADAVRGGLLCPAGSMEDIRHPNPQTLHRAMYFFFGDLFKKRIGAAIAQMEEWPENVGPPLKQRSAELAALETEIKALEDKMRELAEEHAKIANSFH